MSDQFVRDHTGRLRRVVYVRPDGTPLGPAAPTHPPVARPTRMLSAPMVYAPPAPLYHQGAQPMGRPRAGRPFVLVLLLALLGVLLLLLLVAWRMMPTSPAGQAGGQVAGLLAQARTLRLTTNPLDDAPSDDAPRSISLAEAAPAPPPAAPQTLAPVVSGDVPDGELSLIGAPSISPAQIDAILGAYGSPAEGTGADWWLLGDEVGIDPAFAVAFFIHESSAGTNPAWAGWKGDGSSTHNVGNIICAGYATCHGRFRDYGSWKEGIADWYRLIKTEYIEGRGITTLSTIIPVYAPSFENDVAAYVASVARLVRQWRAEGQGAGPAGGRHEVLPGATVTASFTTVNCGFWGNQPGCQHLGTDLSVPGDGVPVYAPFDGTYVRTGEYVPGDPVCPRCLGQFVIYDLTNDAPRQCQLYLGHLKNATTKTPGALVRAGDTLGEIRADLAHTHVQLTCDGQLADFQAYFDRHQS